MGTCAPSATNQPEINTGEGRLLKELELLQHLLEPGLAEEPGRNAHHFIRQMLSKRYTKSSLDFC